MKLFIIKNSLLSYNCLRNYGDNYLLNLVIYHLVLSIRVELHRGMFYRFFLFTLVPDRKVE